MKRYSKITPEGTRDLLFEECVARRNVEEKLTKIFKGMGYNEVETPGVEFYDVFRMDSDGLPSEMMFKLTDYKGRLLVLRPDSTMPIARMTATRLQGAQLPLRLYYNQKTYHSNPSFSGRSDEVRQMGIELIGASGRRADLEVITTAVRALNQCMPDFRIEIGHAGFFKEVSAKMALSDDVCEDIRGYIDAKNYAALDSLLDTLEDSTATRVMRRLPRLFGGEEVFEEAAALCGDEISTCSLDYLKQLYNDLLALGLSDKILIDLGLVHRNEYYTDVIFRGYVQGSGDTVLSGGRYDNLLGKYGSPMPATGFAIDVDSVAKLMLAEKKVMVSKAADVLVHGKDGYELEAIRYAQQLLEQGFRCELSVFGREEEARNYAKNRGIARMDVIGDTVNAIQI